MSRTEFLKDGGAYLIMAVLVVAAAFGIGWLIIGIATDRFEHKGDPSNWLVAIGTFGAVSVALYQNWKQRSDAASDTFRREAAQFLSITVGDFLGKTDDKGRPVNERRHWLNFSRAIVTAQQLAARITDPGQKLLWEEIEHYWRGRVYDALKPEWESFPAEYYGYVGAEKIKNVATSAGARAPLTEPSLVLIYHWIDWPTHKPDLLDRGSRFSEAEIEKMEIFGPRGLAVYIRILRELARPKAADKAQGEEVAG